LRRSLRTHAAAIACSRGSCRRARAQAGVPPLPRLEQLAANDEADPVYRAPGRLLVAQRGSPGQLSAVSQSWSRWSGSTVPGTVCWSWAPGADAGGDTVVARQTLDDLLADR
jgi:hypothetical protein